MCSRPGPRSSSRMKLRPEDHQGRGRGGAPLLERPAEDGVDQEEARQRPGGDRQAGGHRERAERADQVAPVERAVAGSQGEDEGRDPDRQEGGEGQVARQEGEGEARDGDDGDQRRGVDGLRHVEAAEAVDVPGDAPALGDRARQPRELVLQQDDVGDALGDLAARAHRHRHPRLLQRGDVVDAVADHRREPARARERRDQRLLLLGPDPAEDRVAARRRRRGRRGSAGSSEPSITPGVGRDADRRRRPR